MLDPLKKNPNKMCKELSNNHCFKLSWDVKYRNTKSTNNSWIIILFMK